MWPTPSTRCSGGSASSTGPRPSTRGCWPAGTWPGPASRYDRIPYFFSDQFDLSLSYLGHVREWDELVVRGSREVAEPKFVAWYLRDGIPRAALIVNDWDAEDPVREVIRSGQQVDPEQLPGPGA